MNTMNNTSSCLALTVRKEHRLIEVSNVVLKTYNNNNKPLGEFR